jgi:hypothetical protein
VRTGPNQNKLCQVRSALSLLVLILTAVSICVAQKPDGFGNTHPQLYELYSWRQSDGIWSFSVLPSPSGVNTPADAIFNEKFVLRGVDKLKRKISKLPAGTKLLWMDRIASGQTSKAPGSATLMYPPAAVVEEVKQYAQKKHIEVEIVSANPFKS